MSSSADLIARLAINIVAATLSALLVALTAAGSFIAVAGTGGFTSDPRPEHPAWLGLLMLISFALASQWGLLRLRRALMSVLDRAAQRKWE